MLSPVVFGLLAAIHENVDPTLLVNGILTVPPLQIVAAVTLVIVGVGITVTETTCGVPKQPCGVEVGVTAYKTVCTEVEIFIIVFVKGLLVCDVVLSPVVFALFTAIQEKVDALLLVKGMLTVPPLQIVALPGLVMVGPGFMDTVTVCAVPTQPCGFDVGVTVYVTV